jgi:EAL domain-containing protein (putative c-di-GMP-specific phosphodiesterase class I)
VGIALGRGDTARPFDLLRNADTALYRAKGTKERYEMFRPGTLTRTLRRLELEEDLRRAIDRGRFEVHYPPQVIRDSRNGGSGAVGTPETMVMEDEQYVIGVLQDLSALGVRIALDDFGSGFSMLNYVKDLPVDDLKVDKSYFSTVLEKIR